MHLLFRIRDDGLFWVFVCKANCYKEILLTFLRVSKCVTTKSFMSWKYKWRQNRALQSVFWEGIIFLPLSATLKFCYISVALFSLRRGSSVAVYSEICCLSLWLMSAGRQFPGYMRLQQDLFLNTFCVVFSYKLAYASTKYSTLSTQIFWVPDSHFIASFSQKLGHLSLRGLFFEGDEGAK